jgi:hypothetical protein
MSAYGGHRAIGFLTRKRPFPPRASNVEKNLQDDVDFPQACSSSR